MADTAREIAERLAEENLDGLQPIMRAAFTEFAAEVAEVYGQARHKEGQEEMRESAATHCKAAATVCFQESGLDYDDTSRVDDPSLYLAGEKLNEAATAIAALPAEVE